MKYLPYALIGLFVLVVFLSFTFFLVEIGFRMVDNKQDYAKMYVQLDRLECKQKFE